MVHSRTSHSLAFYINIKKLLNFKIQVKGFFISSKKIISLISCLNIININALYIYMDTWRSRIVTTQRISPTTCVDNWISVWLSLPNKSKYYQQFSCAHLRIKALSVASKLFFEMTLTIDFYQRKWIGYWYIKHEGAMNQIIYIELIRTLNDIFGGELEVKQKHLHILHVLKLLIKCSSNLILG